jgi:hypothetical protein
VKSPSSVSRRVSANRQNARRSTGPKSAAGKKRVAQNALRHGLAVSVASLTGFREEVVRLAELIAGVNPTPRCLVLARDIAEAHVDLARIQNARKELFDPRKDLASLAGGKGKLSPFETRQRLARKFGQIIGDVYFSNWVDTQTVAGRKRKPWLAPDAEADLVAFVESIQALSRFDRYEQRALSRLKSAIGAFDELDAG